MASFSSSSFFSYSTISFSSEIFSSRPATMASLDLTCYSFPLMAFLIASTWSSDLRLFWLKVSTYPLLSYFLLFGLLSMLRMDTCLN